MDANIEAIVAAAVAKVLRIKDENDVKTEALPAASVAMSASQMKSEKKSAIVMDTSRMSDLDRSVMYDEVSSVHSGKSGKSGNSKNGTSPCNFFGTLKKGGQLDTTLMTANGMFAVLTKAFKDTVKKDFNTFCCVVFKHMDQRSTQFYNAETKGEDLKAGLKTHWLRQMVYIAMCDSHEVIKWLMWAKRTLDSNGDTTFVADLAAHIDAFQKKAAIILE